VGSVDTTLGAVLSLVDQAVSPDDVNLATETMTSNLITVDRSYLEWATLDTAGHLEASLGMPLELPEHLNADGWATEQEEALCRWFARLTHQQYEHVTRDNTYNSENDFSKNFVFSVFAPVDCSEWYYCDDVFIVVETHLGGDVRGNYGSFQVFRVDNVADTGFLDWTLDWRAEPINPEAVDHLAKLNDQELQRANEEMSNGYSINDLIMPNTKPAWSERLQCWVGRLRDVGFAVKLQPQDPYYC